MVPASAGNLHTKGLRLFHEYSSSFCNTMHFVEQAADSKGGSANMIIKILIHTVLTGAKPSLVIYELSFSHA